MLGDRGSITSALAVFTGTAIVGVIVGAVLGFTGTLDFIGEDPTPLDTATATYHQCPDGPELGVLGRGDRVYVTARDTSGEWVEIRSPNQPGGRVWMRAGQILTDAAIDDLPVLGCLEPASGVVATATTGDPVTTTSTSTTTPPEASTTTTTIVSATTTPSTTTTSPTSTTTTSTTTTVPPDTTPPDVSNVTASPDRIWEQNGLGITCPGGTARQATISAHVTDDRGVASVRAAWTDPSGSHDVVMGSTGGGNYSTLVGPYAAGDWDATSTAPFEHPFTVTVTARDDAGNQDSGPVTVTAIEVGECFG